MPASFAASYIAWRERQSSKSRTPGDGFVAPTASPELDDISQLPSRAPSHTLDVYAVEVLRQCKYLLTLRTCPKH